MYVSIFWTAKYERKSCLNWMVSLSSGTIQVLPCSQLIFPSGFLEFIWIFSGRNHFKIQYLPHSESKSYQISSIKSSWSRSFQQHQRHIPIPKFSMTIYFNFQWRNHSIFKNFCIASPTNIMETRPCTCPHQELSEDTKNAIWSIPVQQIS
jgi:hypothetical protein